MPKSKFTVIRDTREKSAKGWSFDEDTLCAGTLRKKLDTGDYSIQGLEEDILCIERKETIQEFARNCIEKRWAACMERMSKFKHAYLLFEFTWEDIDNYPWSANVPERVRKQMIHEAGTPKIPIKKIKKIVHTAQDYGIFVIACGDAMKAEQVAYKIMKKAYEVYL